MVILFLACQEKTPFVYEGIFKSSQNALYDREYVAFEITTDSFYLLHHPAQATGNIEFRAGTIENTESAVICHTSRSVISKLSTGEIVRATQNCPMSISLTKSKDNRLTYEYQASADSPNSENCEYTLGLHGNPLGIIGIHKKITLSKADLGDKLEICR